MVVASVRGGAGLGADVMMPPPTSFTSRTTERRRPAPTLPSASCLVPLPMPCGIGTPLPPLMLLLARRMIITLPRVMISSRRVMINPLGARVLNRFGTNPPSNGNSGGGLRWQAASPEPGSAREARSRLRSRRPFAAAGRASGTGSPPCSIIIDLPMRSRRRLALNATDAAARTTAASSLPRVARVKRSGLPARRRCRLWRRRRAG
jgi:hypothetical protein